MKNTVYKLVRTAQTQFPFLADVKASGQDLMHRTLRRPHDPDFELFRRFTVDRPLIIDAGANRGQSITAFVVTCQSPRIIAFEPIRKLADRLRSRDEAAIERVEQCALGRVPDRVDIYIPVYAGYVYDGLASLDEDAAHWLNSDRLYGYREDKLVLEHETVDVRPLDSYEVDPDIIKIDVQGTEDDVIAGAVETLRRSEPVLLIEAPSDDLVAHVGTQGYTPYAYRDGELVPDSLGDVNTFFITERRIGQFRSEERNRSVPGVVTGVARRVRP